MARGIYSTTVDAVYKNQGMPGVLKMLRVKNAGGCADILWWALQNNHIDIARQAYRKVSNATKWEMAKRVAQSTEQHRSFPMILGSQDPSIHGAELLWIAAHAGNRACVRFLVRHPYITPALCAAKPNTSVGARQLVDEEIAMWQKAQLQHAVGAANPDRAIVRKM